MRRRVTYITLITFAVLAVLSLVFLCVGMFVPGGTFDSATGFGKMMESSPSIAFESGSLVFGFGECSFNINFSLSKPFFALVSDAPEIHLNVIIVLVILAAMALSCLIPEVSSATSVVVSIMAYISCFRLIPFMRASVESGSTTWQVGGEMFWLLSFIFTIIIVNGVIGIGGKIFHGLFMSNAIRILFTLLLSFFASNAVSMLLSGLACVTVGLGWFGGIVLWLAIASLFVVFCEIMDIMV